MNGRVIIHHEKMKNVEKQVNIRNEDTGNAIALLRGRMMSVANTSQENEHEQDAEEGREWIRKWETAMLGLVELNWQLQKLVSEVDATEYWATDSVLDDTWTAVPTEAAYGSTWVQTLFDSE